MKLKNKLLLGALGGFLFLSQSCVTMEMVEYPKKGLTTMAPWSPAMSAKNKNKPRGFALYERVGFLTPPDSKDSIDDFLKRAKAKTITGIRWAYSGLLFPKLTITGEYSKK